MEETRSFIPLLVVLLIALIVPLVLTRFKRLRLPVVVGEILAGILIGRSGFGWVQQHDPVLDLLAEFGFAFLFFLAGTEIDFSSLARSFRGVRQNPTRSPIVLALLSFALTLALAFGLGAAMQTLGVTTNAWMVGLIFAPSALGIIVAVLKETGNIRGEFGQTILIAALVADFGTLLLFTVSVAILSHGLTFDILLLGLLFVAFFIVYRFGNLFFNRIPGVRRTMEALSSSTTQIKMRAALSMLLIFVVLAEILEAEIVLGAFLAGVIIALLMQPEDREMLHQIEAIGFGFFIPIFFIQIGLDFEFAALLEGARLPGTNLPLAVLYVPLFLVAAFALKIIPAFLFRGLLTTRQWLTLGILLSARLSLIVAEANIELRLGIIDPAVNAAVILTAMLLATLAPLLFTRFAPLVSVPPRPPIVVAGAGELGLLVAEQLRGHQEQIIILDDDEQRLQRARARGLHVHSITHAESILAQTQILVSTYNDFAQNYAICNLARTRYGIEQVVTQVADSKDIAAFRKLGVLTMNTALDRAALLALLARNPAVYELLTRTDDDKTVAEVVVYNPACIDRPLRKLTWQGDVLLTAVRRNGDLIIPHGNTQLAYGDHVTLIGSIEDTQAARDWLTQI